MIDPVVSGAPPPSAITYSNTFTAEEADAVRALLATKGVRSLPYPFASALSVVSDVDASRRHRYDGYIGQLVAELGLDFGDSIWLSWNAGTMGAGRRTTPVAFGLGFLAPALTPGRDVDEDMYNHTRTFNENLVEYHKGNIDHFHAFFMRGIRVAPLTGIRNEGEGRVSVFVEATQDRGSWACQSVFALGVCVVGAPGAALEVRRVRVRTKDFETIEYDPAPYAGAPAGRAHHLFSLAGPADEERSAPSLDQIESVIIDCVLPEHAGAIDRVLLLSAHTHLLIETLAWLRNKYKVEMNLITEHSRFHFSAISKNNIYDKELNEHYRNYNGPVEAYNGSLDAENGENIFSTHSDEPHSFGRVFPEISRDLEFRFVNPAATMSTRGWDPLELVTPSPTRAGGGIYYARRTRPNAVRQTPLHRMDPTPTRQESFAARVSNVLEEVSREPGLFCPLYTHLGSWTVRYEDKGKRDGIGVPLPEPFFDIETMYALQDHVFGITGRTPRSSRVWFTRATAQYDYALILRSIGANITRSGPDRIAIHSWTDECLGKTLPRSAAQLYGLTLYVDDPALAEVTLDGVPIEHLYRNPPDETGRCSVTIAACDLRFVVFDQVNPVRTATPESPDRARPGDGDVLAPQGVSVGARWIWRAKDGAERNFGRLRLASTPATGRSGRAIGSLRFPMFGWTATGAQSASLLCRAPADARFGVLLETRTGGRFFFGDDAADAFDIGQIDASYSFTGGLSGDGGWRRFTVPFHDLAWKADARSGGPMPNHPLEAVTLLAAAPAGTVMDFADLAFLRPRTIAGGNVSDGGYCLGGRVLAFLPGLVVHSLRVDDASWSRRETTVDQRGFFCFDGMARGVYEVWTRLDGAPVHDRRGRRVEVSTDNLLLELGGPEP